MKTVFKRRATYALLTAVISSTALSVTVDVLADTTKKRNKTQSYGKLNVNFRYRFENVDDDARPKEAHASTLRARLTYLSNTIRNFQASVELDHMEAVGGDNYDDLHGDTIDHAVVADPKGTEVNQAWIAYSGLDSTILKVGRQRINLDNQRFIGGVGWRQNEQTYDGISVINTSLPKTTFFYAHVNNINRIFGPNTGRMGTPAADVNLDADANIFNISYKGMGLGTLSAYAYLLDIDDHPATRSLSDTLSTKTFGARLTGSQGDDIKLLYTAEFSRQSDYKRNPISYNANYYNLEGGLLVKDVTIKLGLDVLAADDDKGVAFSTPLATLHKFQGFADKFLNTPERGIKDTYASVFATIHKANVGVIYHDFKAEEGSTDYGDEIDLVTGKQIHKNAHLLLKYANYNAHHFGSDTEKVWVQLTVSF